MKLDIRRELAKSLAIDLHRRLRISFDTHPLGQLDCYS
jgi:hypothetical protein